MTTKAPRTALIALLATLGLATTACAQDPAATRPPDRNTTAASATHASRTALEPLRAWQFVARGNADYVARRFAARAALAGPILEGQPRRNADGRAHAGQRSGPARPQRPAGPARLQRPAGPARPQRPAGADRYVCAVLACADLDVDLPMALGLQRRDVLVLRAPGPFASKEATALLERAVRRHQLSLVLVLGHGRCDALRPSPGVQDALSRRLDALRARTGARKRPLHEALVHKQRELLLVTSETLRDAADDGRLAVVPAAFDAATGAVRSLAPHAQLQPIPAVR
jgi:carbonic anhydrase